MSGWIKLHRNLIDWEWYTDHNTCRLFVHCILKANHADKNWRGIDIKRGSFYTSLDTLAEETGLTPMQIRTSLKKLKSTGEVTGSGMARGRMITVVEYDSYQEDNRLSNSLVTGLQQADNRLVTANKNDNKVKNIKPLSEVSLCDEEKKLQKEARTNLINNAFDFFWEAWPNKKSRQVAYKSFVKLCRTKSTEQIEEFVNTVSTDITKRVEVNQLGFDHMHASTYLNQERWTDSITQEAFQ